MDKDARRSRHLLELLARSHQTMSLNRSSTGVKRYHKDSDCELLAHHEILGAQKQTVVRLCNNLQDMNAEESSRS